MLGQHVQMSNDVHAKYVANSVVASGADLPVIATHGVF